MPLPGTVFSEVKCAKRVGMSAGRWRVHFADGTSTAHARLVAAVKVGRALLPEEVVHHRNGDPADDRLENLEVYSTQSAHMRNGVHRRNPSIARFTELGPTVAFLARLPASLKTSLAEVAQRDGRSLNSEIIIRLQRSLKDQPSEWRQP